VVIRHALSLLLGGLAFVGLALYFVSPLFILRPSFPILFPEPVQLPQVLVSLSELAHRSQVLRASLQETLSTLEHSKVAAEKRERLKASYEGVLKRVEALLDAMEKGDGASARILLQTLFSPERVDISGALPLHVSTFTPPPPSQGAQKPSYETIPQPKPQASDLAGTLPLLAIEPEVEALAKELKHHPVHLYEWIKVWCRYEPGWGGIRSSSQVIRERRGTDADLNGLLIALLRASEYPAKFVHGVMELKVERVMNWVGVEDDEALGRALTRAGIPHEMVIEGGRVTKVRLEHVWAEVWIDYSGYRGIPIRRGREEWIPLDVSITGINPFTTTSGPTLSSLELTAMDTLRPFLEGPVTLSSPLSAVEEAMRQRLSLPPAQPLPLSQRNKVWEVFGLLPSTLPYDVPSVIGEYGFLPEALTHRLHLKAQDEAGRILMDATLSLPEVTGKRLTLSYVGATPEDEALIIQYGGMMTVPPAMVEVTPIIRVQGKEVARGTQGIGLGRSHTLTVELLTPSGVERVNRDVIAGSYLALGIAPWGMKFSEPTPVLGTDREGDGPRLLYTRVASLLDQWAEAEEKAEALSGVRVIRPTASLALVKNEVQPVMVGDVPVTLTWQGVGVDALVRTSSPIAARTTSQSPSQERDFLLLSGFNGSYLEEDILAQGFSVESISTLKHIRLAKERGTSILTITPANQGTELPRLQVHPDILAHVQDLLHQGTVVTIPQTELSYYTFTGTGYVALNEQTGEGGYFLGGRYVMKGAKTVVAPEEWVNQDIVDALRNAHAGRVNPDPESAVTITKLQQSDYQRGLVGLPLEHPLFTFIQDKDGLPVKGARVVYEVLSLGGQGIVRGTNCQGQPVSGLKIEVCTDTGGFARVQYEPATDINTFFTLMKLKDTDVYPTRVGVNRVTATLITSRVNVILTEPFYATGLPHAAHHLTPVTGPSAYGTEQFALPASWQVRCEDQYNNWLANETMVWDVLPGGGRVMEGKGVDALEVIRLNLSDPRQKISLSLVTPTEGLTEVRQVLGSGGGLNELQVSLPSYPGVVPLTIDAYGIPLDPETVSLQVGYDRINDRALSGRALKRAISAEMYYKDSSGSVQKITQVGGAIQSASVSYRVCLGAEVAPCATDPQYQESPSLANGGTISFTPTLLPQYGTQRVEVRAEVTFTSNKTDSTSFFAFIEVGSVKIVLERESPTHLRYPTGDPGLLFTSDRNLIVNVENPANWPVRTKVSQTPVDATKPILFIPDPSTDVPVRDPVGSEYFLVKAHATEHWLLPVINTSLGGKVDAKVFTPEEMTSPIATASAEAIRFRIKTPVTGQALRITNNTQGVPQMPRLAPEVEVTNLPPGEVASLPIYWRVRVNYEVTAPAAPQRARSPEKGDKIWIPEDPTSRGVTHVGPTGYVVDWTDQFGGGELLVEAEADIRGTTITDSVVCTIEGEKFNDTFKSRVVNYLMSPDGDRTTPTIRDQVGEPRVFRVIAWLETAYRHFYPSIFGRPTGAWYPRENGGGDGGLGLMQLTIPRASYRESWLYQENVEAAILLVREKLNRARGYPGLIRTQGCTPPLCKPRSRRFSQATDFTSDQLRMDFYSLYNSSWHYWRWRVKSGEWIPDRGSKGYRYVSKARALEQFPPIDF